MILNNGVLKVDLLPLWHDSTRFDRTMTVRQVTRLDKGARYLTDESLTPGVGTGGIGMCDEFGIEEPIGYDDALVGECFLKPGVGWLKRPEGAYRFAAPHDVADRGTVLFRQSGHSVEAAWSADVKRGYGVRFLKRYQLDWDRLNIIYSFENIGEKHISTTAYNHNFMIIDDHPYNGDYSLTTDDEALNKAHPALVTLDKFPSYIRISAAECDRLRGWTLTYEPGNISVSEWDDVQPTRFCVWALEHVVSAEMFVGIELDAGQSMNWRRTYHFQ